MIYRSNKIATGSHTSNDSERKNIESFFALAGHWQSDLKFFADELRFLKGLMGKYGVWLTDENNIKSSRIVGNKLAELDKRRSTIEEKVLNHSKHLANFFSNPFADSVYVYKEEHGDLEIALSTFVKDFQVYKKNVFALTEHIIGTETDQQLLQD